MQIWSKDDKFFALLSFSSRKDFFFYNICSSAMWVLSLFLPAL